jgi:hypothetical protein
MFYFFFSKIKEVNLRLSPLPCSCSFYGKRNLFGVEAMAAIENVTFWESLFQKIAIILLTLIPYYHRFPKHTASGQKN